MKLIRTSTSDEGTFGILVYGDDYAHTLEPPWRGNQRNLSCIPAGKYEVRMRHSPKYGDVYHVKKVPNRTYILMHAGNWAGDEAKGFKTDTDGCILVGSKRGRLNGQQALLASRAALSKVTAAMNFEPFELEIIDPEAP